MLPNRLVTGIASVRRSLAFKPALEVAFLRAGRAFMLVCWSCTVLVAAIPAVLMVLTGRLVSSITAVDTSAATRYAVLFVGTSLVYVAITALLAIAEASLSARFVVWVETKLANATLTPNGIAQLESPSLRRKIDVATENSREGAHLVAVGSYFQTMQWRLSGIIAAGLLATYSLWSAAALLAGYLTLTWAFRRWLATIYDDLTETMESDRRRPDYLRRVLTEPEAAKEIRIFGALPWLDARFGESWAAAMGAVWRRRSAAMLPLALGIAALVVAHAAVFAWLALSGLAGALAVGQIVVVVQAAAGIEALSRYGDVGAQVARARRAVLYLDDLASGIATEAMDLPRAVPGRKPDPTAPAVELDGVVFSYGDGRRTVLDHIDLAVPRGQTLGVVGANGAGKSTLVKLISGLYIPDSGEVRINGRCVLDISSASIGVVFQSFGRYEMSVRDNVSMGRHGSLGGDDLDIRRALGRAGGLQMFDESDLDTILSTAYPGGKDLSGGQWQRMALARAFYALDKGADVLILDEPTASLDVRSECEIFEQFVGETRSATTIIVSHRLNSVRTADRIVVLHDGRIIEDGSHDELLEKRGRYSEMFEIQARRFVDVRV